MKEPITIKGYSSPRTFQLFDVSWSGSCVLFHGFGGMFVGDAIDLIFICTDYLQVPSEINGITISQPGDQLAVEFERKFGSPRLGEEPEGKRVFAIESEEQRYHVIAARMWVLVRTHNGKSSLPVLFGGDLDACDAYLTEHVKEWYRMASLYE